MSRRDSTRLREFTFMATHKSANFTFSTYLHFMTKDLLALLYVSSNIADQSPKHAVRLPSLPYAGSDSQKPVVCAMGIVMAGTGFQSRSTKLKPQKAGFPKLRRCHGSTSPSLANMHPNSGHRVRSQRQGAKKES